MTYPAAGAEAGYVIHSLTHFQSIFCNCPYDEYGLTFTWLYRLTTATRLLFKSDAPAAVGSSGNAFIVVWIEPPTLVKANLFGLDFQPLVLSTKGPIQV